LGDDWSALIDKYIDVTNRVLRVAPGGVHIGMHLCRGNRGGHWHAEGSYEEVAERLFNALAVASISWNTIRRAPAVLCRCASCRSINRSCSGLTPPKCRTSRTKRRSKGASRRRPNSWRWIGSA